jgi:hypothetical protein
MITDLKGTDPFAGFFMNFKLWSIEEQASILRGKIVINGCSSIETSNLF